MITINRVKYYNLMFDVIAVVFLDKKIQVFNGKHGGASSLDALLYVVLLFPF